ncbi:AMP-binding protein [Salinibacterium sp. ZJ70]|uniref:AMP-binding protein n=1 Tax=Salinibacterium sp. ZJ70 TaxID=2708084 RepID=UPI001CD1E4CC|nr:AMP-binding protein [Salinibacterium sp. ZJ70]
MTSLSTARTIPQLLAERAQLDAHPALVDGSRVVSYRELSELSHHAARAYLADGVTRGDRIAIWAENRIEFALALLGAQLIGASVVPLNTRFTGREAAELLERSGARVLVVSDGFLGKSYAGMLRDALADQAAAGSGPVPALPTLRTIVHLDDATGTDDHEWAGYLARGAAVSEDALSAATAQVSPDDIADLLFTSGTTGAPKGVPSTQRQTISVAYAWALGAELSPSDRYAVVNPMFHGFGYKAGLITCIVAGATVYPLATLDTTGLLDLIERERISVLPGVPTVFTSLLDHPEVATRDTSSLRFATAGAATAPETLFQDMKSVLGFDRVAQAYGLSECVVATMTRKEDDIDHVKQTSGPAVAGIEIKVVNADGVAVATGEDGEILLRGADVMRGYYDDPEATAAAIDPDGWLHTGDIGQLDEHGCLKITDRLKDMYIVGGFNVYPAEIENVLRKHPAVNESAVIGIDDARLGNVGRAYVVLRHDAPADITPESLHDFCRTHLANFKVPREFVFVSDFPRTGAGKILKGELRDRARQETAARA